MSDLAAAHQEALERGELTFQRCVACAHAWLPPRERCPRCLADGWVWETAGGRGRLVSWVVYHRAYHDSVADRVPYKVSLIELEEGPRLVANMPEHDGPDAPPLSADMTVVLDLRRVDGAAVACFKAP
ncbi:MAG: uncharacterized protein V7607_2945 [Solirubrobacteraceae bacterium]